MLDETGLWRDVVELPSTLRATLENDVDEVAGLIGADGVRRVVASGNGAAYYVAVALWLASLESASGPELVAVPSGLLARGAFAWRPGDVFLAVSSSGEFRDLVEAVDGGAPAPYGAVTANAGSTLGARAGARALVSVPSQRAVTHTQAFCGGVVAALRMWAAVTADDDLDAALRRLPHELERTVGRARAWADELGHRPRMPDARTNAAMIEVRRIWHAVSLVERDTRLNRGPEPDIGFSEVAYGWAAGRALSAVLHGSDFTAGDFVRWVRQVADFAGQIADAAGTGDLRDTARLLVRSMRRGVVTYAPEMDADEGDDLTGVDLP